MRLDPKAVRPSKWANRHESTFSGEPFKVLKAEIGHAGGNVQPIKVRPVAADQYEIVYGHRRHRACLELGIPVLATIADLDDRSLWEEMERENRAREDLSPYEQGRHYRVALQAGLYPSIRRLASAIGVDVSQAAKVIRIADLPNEVLAAFASPNHVQVNWASSIKAALERDPDAVLKRAKKLASERGSRARPKAIFDALVLPTEGVEPFHTRTVELTDPKSGGRAVIRRGEAGNYTVEIVAASVSLSALKAAIQGLLKT